uniref:Ubiquitin-like domain-containing protein n=1 Tax=Plectus sambesii TaxID=2011161 RepID=A0A914VWD2_9BILA
MDLFFEIQRKKTHIFCDAKDSSTVLELKKVIEGILKIPTGEQTLKKQADDQAKTWETLDDAKSLSDCGFSTLNAKAQHPAVVALCLVKDGQAEDVMIDPLSTPPPLPDVMRAQEGGQGSDSGTN